MDRRTLFLGAASVLALAAFIPSNPLWGWRIGSISDVFARGYSHCGRCKTNWGFVDGHVTQFVSDETDGDWYKGANGKLNAASGIFPLCEQCWSDLTPDTRLPFYRSMFDEQERRWPEIAYADPPRAWAVWQKSVMCETVSPS